MRLAHPGPIYERDPAGDTQIAIDGEVSVRMSVQRLGSMLDPADLPACRDRILVHILDTVAAMEGMASREGSVDFDTLVAILRPTNMIQDYEEGVRQTAGNGWLVTWEVFPGISAVLVFDSPRGYNYINGASLPGMGLSVESARELALSNLRRRLETAPPEFSEDDATIFVSGYDGMASSLLLLPEVWEPLRARLADDLIVHTLDKNEIVVMSKNDPMSVLGTMKMLMTGEFPSYFPCAPLLYDAEGFKTVDNEQIAELLRTHIATMAERTPSKPH